jgi:tetratricopeptide (TPR) repeat protein
MTDSKPKEIIQAEKLIEDGRTEEALEIIRDYQQTAWGYFFRIESDKALEIALQSKEIMEKIGEDVDIGNNSYLIGHIYLLKFNLKEALKYGIQSLEIRKKFSNHADLGASYSLMGLINRWLINYPEAIKFCQKSLSFKEISPRIKLDNLNAIANMLVWTGEVSRGLKYSEEGILLAEELELPNVSAGLLYNRGFFFLFMGNFKKAEEDLLKSLKYTDPPELILLKAMVIQILITAYIEQNSMSQAEKYLKELKEIMDHNKNNSFIAKLYSVAKGLTLYLSSRTRDRAKAENLFKQVVDDGPTDLYVYIYALYCLIFIYVEELRISDDFEIIEEINPLISDLYRQAEQIQSTLFQIEAKVFQAKIELIKKKVDAAKILLSEAQHLAEMTGNQYFAQIISNEHDRLLELQQNQDLEGVIKNPKPEGIRLGSFRSIVNLTQRKNLNESSEMIPEIPVLLLIIAEGGVLLFSYPFTDEWKYDTEIFGSFLSAFTSFSDEFFSKGLDRVKFGEDTLLMQSVDSYSIGYLYKGQSYPAKQKLNTFIHQIKEKSSIWQILENYKKTSQVLEVRNVPQLNSIIEDVFLKSERVTL